MNKIRLYLPGVDAYVTLKELAIPAMLFAASIAELAAIKCILLALGY